MTDNQIDAKPKFLFDCLTDITIDDLKKMGVKLVAIDLDNTSVYDCSVTPIKGVKEWVKKVKKAGFKNLLFNNI